MSLLCLVPTALRASRVTRRLCDAQGGALFGRQATTFDALAASLVAASGDRRPVLGPLGERLLAVEVGRRAGGPFAALSAAEGLAGSLLAALAELRRGEVGAAEAREVARTLAGGARGRLELLASALEGWERWLEERALLDRAGALRAAASAARARVTVPETERPSLLLLDGFASLAPAEWDLFTALAGRADAVRIHLPHLADRPAATAAAEPLARRLESLHDVAVRKPIEVLLDRTDDEARAQRVAALLAAMAGATPTTPAAGSGIVRASCAGAEADEPRAVAATAAEWVAAGMAPEELRVVSPSPSIDGPRLAAAFGELGLPFSQGRGAALGGVPVVRVLREALGAAGTLGRASAERLARSSYLSLGDPVDRLDALLDRAGALDGRKGPVQALRDRASALGAGRERAGIGRAAARLEALRALLAPLDEPGTARRHAARLAAFIERAGVRRRAARAEPRVAARDLAAISRVLDAAEEAARSLALLGVGEATLSRLEWVPILDAAISAARLPAPGEPYGGAVELLGLEDVPGESARGVLIMGCSRGKLPVPPPPEPLLREPERQALNSHLRRAAVVTAAGRHAEAAHRALGAVAAARDAVLFTWQADDGPVAPLVEAGLAAAGVPAPREPSPPPGLAEARSPTEWLRAAVRSAVAGEAPAAAPSPALEGRLATALARGGVEGARRASIGSLAPVAGAGAVPPEEVAPSLPAEWTPSQLEEYARCPFRLFLGVGVGLRRPEGTGLDIEPSDEGSLLHAALERLVAARVARGAWPPGGGEGERAEAIEVADALFAEFEEAGRTGDPSVWRARKGAVRARLVRWVEAEARDADGLVPRLLEHRFGGSSGRPPLRFGTDGVQVAVQGRIDRVDADGRRLLVVDYKNSRSGTEKKALLDPESFGVTSFQIPIYLAAAARELPGREELGATLALLKDGERLEPFRGEAAVLAGGALGEPLASAVTGIVARARAGRFPIASRDCGHCELGAVCRGQGAAELEEGAEGEG